MKPQHVKLAAAFAARKCAVCGAAAVVVSPGSDAVHEAGMLLVRPQPGLNLCLAHAVSIGWPWESEAKPAPRRATR